MVVVGFLLPILIGELPSLCLEEGLACWSWWYEVLLRAWLGWRSTIGAGERVRSVLSNGGHMIWLTCLTPTRDLAMMMMKSRAIWRQPPIHRSFVLLVEPPATNVSHLLLHSVGALKLLLRPLSAFPFLLSIRSIWSCSWSLVCLLPCYVTMDAISFSSSS